MKRTLTLAACLALAIAPMAAIAQQSATPPAAPASAAAPAAPQPAGNAPAPNPEQGHTLSYTCQGCHGVTGYKNAYPNYHVPKIGGQSAAYLTQALTEYKQGKRTHPTMQAQASSFTEQDIADLAAYLSTLK